jgi:hypothetical protein
MAGDRKALSTRTRFEVFKRDRFTCQYCGRTPPAVVLHVDHILAVANGGTDEECNLITSCVDCNLGKSDVPLESSPPALAHTIEEQREKLEQLIAYSDFLMEKRQGEIDQVRKAARAWSKLGMAPWTVSERMSVRQFLARLPLPEIIEAVEIAASKFPTSNARAFRYFCGVCWSKIKQSGGQGPAQKR